MKLRTRTIGLLAAVMAVSLSGLIYLQYLLLRDAAGLKEQAFRQNVTAAMHSIAQKLQTQEAVNNAFRYRSIVTTNSTEGGKKKIMVKVDTNTPDDIETHGGPNWQSFGYQTGGDSRAERIHVFTSNAPPVVLSGNTLKYTVSEPQHVTLRLFNSLGRQDTVLVDSFRNAGVYVVTFDKSRFGDAGFYCKFGTDQNAFVTRLNVDGAGKFISSFSSTEERRAMVGTVIDNLMNAEGEPVERRIDPRLLDSLIRASLSESGISLPCTYAVLNQRSDSLRMITPAADQQALRASEFRASLFPFDFLANNNLLLLHFPDERAFLWKAIGPMLVLSILFTTAIIVCFSVTLRMIVRQQQFSGRLTDFINNMTHEFKTPVSTIAVAAETMQRPEILEQPERLLRYSGVIRDENQRMKSHIDRILQMAVLEDGEYELKRESVEVHTLVQQALEPLRLRVEARDGSIRTEFAAAASVVFGDPVHLSNVFHNLLDNADKYSPVRPDIRIETSESGGTLTVRVSDCGIGISSDEQQKVFEKYYRVPTGNVHNVKGFGLGLSYVKLIIEAHGGNVALESDPGLGTVVTVTLPLEHRT